MKRKFFAGLAVFLVLFTGVLSPVVSLVLPNNAPQVAHAQIFSGTGSTTTASNVDQITCGMNVLCAIVTGYSGFIQFLPHLLAQISGMLLDYTVWKNLESSTWTSQDTVDSFVVKGWKMVRDFSNLLFIFALFAVGFSLILNGAGTDSRPLFGLDPKRTIARVILMALLINFSFFMCRFIIEVTNLTAGVFYNSITKVDVSQTTYTQSTKTSDNTKVDMGKSADFYKNFSGIRSVSLGILSLTDAQKLILNASDIKGTYKEEAFGAISWYEYDWGVYILLMFVATVSGVFNFFLVYLFLSSSIFLFSRIYGLYFLIILSPIAFVSTTIPALQSKEYFGFDDWFKQLTGLAFAMPIYLFFMYLAIFFMRIGEATTGSGYVYTATIILVKLISAGFILIFGKKVTKDLSGKIGAMASGAVSGIVTGTAMIAGAAMTGGASAALRMGGGLARNAAVNTASRVGEAVAGRENVEAIRQRFSSGNFKSFSRLNNFNPLRGMSDQKTIGGGVRQLGRNVGAGLGEAARMSGSELPDKISTNFRAGKVLGISARKEQEQKDLNKKKSEVDTQINNLKNQLNDPKTPEVQKGFIKSKIELLEQQKSDLDKPQQNPSPSVQGTNQNSAAPAQNQTGGGQSGAQPNTSAGGGVPKPPQGTGTSTGGSTTPSKSLKDISLKTPDGKSEIKISKEQSDQIAKAIGDELAKVTAEMNDPANRSDASKMEGLRNKYQNLKTEAAEMNAGKISGPRLKTIQAQERTAELKEIQTKNSSFAGRTLGDGKDKNTYTEEQQARIFRKAFASQERTEKQAAAQAKGASKTQSLLSGIATGATTSVTSTPAPVIEQVTEDFDQGGLIETPDTMDFGGMQIPNPEAGTVIRATSTLNNPITTSIPVVGSTLANVGQIAGAIKSVGTTGQTTSGLVDRFGNPLRSSNSDNSKAA